MDKRMEEKGKGGTKIKWWFELRTGEKEEESFILGSDDEKVTKKWAVDIAEAVWRLLKEEKSPLIGVFGWQHNIFLGTLFFAALTSDHVLAEKLLTQEPEIIDEIDDNQLTASHIAAYVGHVDVMSVLLKFSPNLKFSSPFVQCSRLPLHMAAINGHAEIVALLLRHDPSLLDLQDSDGRTALELAVFHPCAGSVDCIIELVNCGADANAVVDGRSLLHVSVELNHLEIAKTLLNVGAVLDFLDDHLQTPLEYAIRMEFMPFVQLFVERGAQVNRAFITVLPAPPSSTEEPQSQITRVTDFANLEIMSYLVRNGTFLPCENTGGALDLAFGLFGSKKQNLISAVNEILLDPNHLNRLKVMRDEFLKRPEILGDDILEAAEHSGFPLSDETLPRCSICCDEFTLVNRRHHCRR